MNTFISTNFNRESISLHSRSLGAYSKFKERSALGVLAHISYDYKNGSLTEAHVCTLFLCRANRRSNLKSIFDCNFEPAEDSTEIAEVG